MPNLASYFGAYRLLESRVAELQEELVRERREKTELLNKVLHLAKLPPMFYEPPAMQEAKPAPPIGPTAKRAMLSQVPLPSEKSDEEILEAARRAQAGNGNHR